MENKIKWLWGRMLINFFFLLLPLVQPCRCHKVCRGCLTSHWCNLFALQLCVAGSHCNLNESLQLVSACDLRPLWSHVLQHHHHHLCQAFASRFGFLSNASERKPETELLVWKHERVATEKKRSWSWSAPIKISLLFFSSLLCPPPPLLSPAVAQRSSSRPRSPRARNQIMAVPALPVLGTRERLCPFHPCRGPKSQSAFCDGPGSAPPRRARSVEIREFGSAGPGPIGLLWWTRAPSQT